MTFTIEYDHKHPRQDGTCAVYLRIYDGRIVRSPLSIHVAPGQWDAKKARVKFGHPMAALYNRKIAASLQRAEEIHLKAPALSAKQVRDQMKRKGGATFVELARSVMDQVSNYHTRKKWGSVIRRFEEFAPEVATEAIDPALMARWLTRLSSEIKRNSAAVKLRTIRTIYNRVCKTHGIRPLRILDGVDAVERYPDQPEFLDPSEVRALSEFALTAKGWEKRAVDMWLFSLYCGGIRWTDLCRIGQDKIRAGRLVYQANKTGKAKNIKLHPNALAILEQYQSDPVFGVDPRERKIETANTLANRALKSAAVKCGITKRLHTHNARHSFAAWALASGMDDRAIQQVLGVTPKTFEHYRARFPQEAIDEAMGKVFD